VIDTIYILPKQAEEQGGSSWSNGSESNTGNYIISIGSDLNNISSSKKEGRGPLIIISDLIYEQN